MDNMTVSSISLISLNYSVIIKNSDKNIKVFFHANIGYVRFSNIGVNHTYFSVFLLLLYYDSLIKSMLVRVQLTHCVYKLFGTLLFRS